MNFNTLVSKVSCLCRFGSFVIFCLSILNSTQVQAQQCDSLVPSFVVDLSATLDSSFISVDTSRNGNCCGTVHPDKCIKFLLTLHPDAAGIMFDIYSGAIPSGAMFYQISCSSPTAVGSPLCLNGPGPHEITFCKPGNNPNEYFIQSLPKHSVSEDVHLHDGCTVTIYAVGYAPGSFQWTSINPGNIGDYDALLGCSTCDTTSVAYPNNPPPFVDFQVSGLPLVYCDTNIVSDTVRVYFYTPLNISTTPVNPLLCYGNQYANVSVIGSGGVPPYSYLWSNGATTASVQVGVGSYTVAMQDTSACSQVIDTVVVLQQPSPVLANAGTDQVICEENLPVTLTGSISNTNGFSWLGGNGIVSPNRNSLIINYMPTAQEITNGLVQLYLVANGISNCAGDTDTVSININTFDALVTQNIQHVSCYGGNDASIALQINGGTSPFNVNWMAPLNTTGLNVSALFASNGTFIITDGNGCTSSFSYMITEPPPLSMTLNSINPTCFNQCNGAISSIINGGSPPYNYSWSSGQSTAALNGGCSGTYTLQITDQQNCTTSNSITLYQPVAINTNIVNTNISCFNGNDGSLDLSVSGGTTPYTFYWSNGSTSEDISMLTAGTYSVTITDANNCTAIISSNLTQPLDINTNVLITDVLCYEQCNGSALLQVAGGTGSYTYLWSDGTSTANNLMLCDGIQSVIIEDANNCTDTVTFIIQQPDSISGLLTSVNETCNNSGDGSINLQVSGGTSPYSYQWSNSNTNSYIGQINAGVYSVVVTDINNCQAIYSDTLETVPPLSIEISPDTAICKNSHATILANVSGGNHSNYTYHWSNPQFVNQGPYQVQANIDTCLSVYATDTAGCLSDTVSVCITVYPDLQLQVNQLDSICDGDTLYLQAFVNGGLPPYNYIWNQGLSYSNSFYHLPKSYPVGGDYIIEVTDQCAITVTDILSFGYYESPVMVALVENVEDCAPLDVQFYNYSSNSINCVWNLGDGNRVNNCDSFSYTYTTPGSYVVSLEIESEKGCKASDNQLATVHALTAPNAAFAVNPRIVDLSDPTYTFINKTTYADVFKWDFGDGTTSTEIHPVHMYTDTGSYHVTLHGYNVLGCVDSFSLTVKVNATFHVIIPNAFSPNGDGNNEVFYPIGQGILSDHYELQIFNRWGDLIFESKHYDIPWDGTVKHSSNQAKQDVYVYKVKVFDLLGKAHVMHGTVALIR